MYRQRLFAPITSERMHNRPRLLTPAIALGLALVSGACASTGGVPVPKPFPTPGPTARRGTPAATPEAEPAAGTPAPARAAPTTASVTASAVPLGDAYALVGTALALRGVPYRDGGADPKGFDCSGFTQYVFAQYGVPLPRAVREQFRFGKNVKAGDLEPGDLVFFTTTEPGASHVAIAVGTDQFVHAPSSTGAVRVERLSSSYWATRFVGARRVTQP